MKTLKNEILRIKEITLLHVIVAAVSALLAAGYSVLKAPINQMTVSPAAWVLMFTTPAAAMFLFYACVRKPETSVFRAVKYLYLIGSPILLVSIADLLIDPRKPEYWSEHFYGGFLPAWIAVWWGGALVLYVLMRVLGHAVGRGIEKGSFGARLVYALAVMYTPQKTVSTRRREGKAKWFMAAVCILMVAVAVFLGTVTAYLYTVYSNMKFEAILFTMRFAAGGLAIEDIIAGTAIFLIFAGITAYLCYHLLKCFRNDELVVSDTRRDGKYTLTMNTRKRTANLLISAVLLFVGVTVFSGQTGFMHYIDVKLDRSSIYDDYYVKPDSSVVSFPGEKRNLIFIYLESMENTYASKDAGGDLDKNYISALTELTKEKDCYSFSNTEKLGGASVYVPSITYTMGSTVAQTSGIALNTQLFPENGKVEYPDMIRLEDILHDNGYNQLYIEGSKGEFSLYDVYVGRYDDSRVFDRKTASDMGYTDDSGDYMWKWGIEDRKLYEITKELITDMSKEDKPFFVTMYTMDTHSFESGHRCPYCDSSIKSDYLAAVDCTSRQAFEFVEWAKQQPFYENTTIILVGDHLGNEHTTMVDIDSDYVRTTYNCFINPAKTPKNINNRVFSSLDMFPSTLSAIGAEIRGDRLGLGTDLFSGTKTLCEELGEEEYKIQLERTSDYYRREFYGIKEE